MGRIDGPGLNYALSGFAGAASQVGTGASGKNRNYGATLFLSYGRGTELEINVEVRSENNVDCFFDHSTFLELNCPPGCS